MSLGEIEIPKDVCKYRKVLKMGSSMIVASNGLQLSRAVQEQGHSLREVVFKAPDSQRRKYGKRGLPHSCFSDRNEDLEGQFMHLKRLRRVSDKIVEPLSLVVSNDEVVGYVMRRAHGRTLTSVFNAARNEEARARERRKAAELFVHAAFEVIDVLEQIQWNGMAHGDPAPRNTLVTTSARITLIDPLLDSSAAKEDRIQAKELKGYVKELKPLLR